MKNALTLTISPLSHTGQIAALSRITQNAAIAESLVAPDRREWQPLKQPVTNDTTFTITELKGEANSWFTVSTKGNAFGLAHTLDAARAIAHIFMAAPPPSPRFGYMAGSHGFIVPVAFSSQRQRERHFQRVISRPSL